MAHVLNAQSDGIIVVKSVQETTPQQTDANELEFQFCNSKSVELFGVNVKESKILSEQENEGPASDNQALNLLNEQRFKSLNRVQSAAAPSSGIHDNLLDKLVSLHDIMLSQPLTPGRADIVESYSMLPDQIDVDKGGVEEKTIIVKRMKMIFNETEC